MKLLSVKFVFKKDEASKCVWDRLVLWSLTGFRILLKEWKVKKETLSLFCFLHLWSNKSLSRVMTLTDVVPHSSKPHLTHIANAPWLCTNFYYIQAVRQRAPLHHTHTHTHTPPETPPLSKTMWSRVRDQRSFPGPNPPSLPQTSSHGLNQCRH